MPANKHSEQLVRMVAQQLLSRQRLLVLIGSVTEERALESALCFQCPLQRLGCSYCWCQASICRSAGFFESAEGGQIVVPRRQLIVPASMNP